MLFLAVADASVACRSVSVISIIRIFLIILVIFLIIILIIISKVLFIDINVANMIITVRVAVNAGMVIISCIIVNVVNIRA